MRLFGNKGTIEESDQPEPSEVIARVEIKRVDRKTRDINAFIVDCVTSETVYKATYTTKASTDFYAFNGASDDLKNVIDREDYILRGDITTNSTDIPFARTLDKSTYGR
ncbi:hypothetical protein [Virgibacillus necropolis]|uniref:Uncharacterized protein n=1 Tax=Virgibacillus necropolis TaxID=163877 RepID=A0A221MGQ4_9BACI|nr:hypothetical protein [Virgibacillus necropolis]ASN06843.1 hypothetical protein CFK40_18360 [Virgibacillus necropolis]